LIGSKELIAKLALSKGEITRLYQGGVVYVKIKGKYTEISVEISCKGFSERKGTRIRFKTIDAE
jgi:DNA-binding protein YbaB